MISIDLVLIYLQDHPLVSVFLAILLSLFVVSIIRMLLRIALILFVILGIVMYWTHNEAYSDWQVRLDEIGQKVTDYGEKALGVGKNIVERNGGQLIEKGIEQFNKN